MTALGFIAAAMLAAGAQWFGLSSQHQAAIGLIGIAGVLLWEGAA